MSEAWINFFVVIFVQFILFVVHACYRKKLHDLPRILGIGVASGLVLGLIFDFVLGKFFGLFSYNLGFGFFFLIVNGALAYGLFASHVLLMNQVRWMNMYLGIMVVAVVYEITNLFFPVWAWEFVVSDFEFFLILSVGNFGAAVMLGVIWHKIFHYRFNFLQNLDSKNS